MFGQVAVRPDRLGQLRSAAVASIDLEAAPVNDDAHGQKRGQQADDRGTGRCTSVFVLLVCQPSVQSFFRRRR